MSFDTLRSPLQFLQQMGIAANRDWQQDALCPKGRDNSRRIPPIPRLNALPIVSITIFLPTMSITFDGQNPILFDELRNLFPTERAERLRNQAFLLSNFCHAMTWLSLRDVRNPDRCPSLAGISQCREESRP